MSKLLTGKKLTKFIEKMDGRNRIAITGIDGPYNDRDLPSSRRPLFDILINSDLHIDRAWCNMGDRSIWYFTIEFIETSDNKARLESIYEKLTASSESHLSNGVKLIRLVSQIPREFLKADKSTDSIYRTIALEFMYFREYELDDYFKSLVEILTDHEVKVDMSRIHVSKSGLRYHLPKGVSRYGLGYLLQYRAGIIVHFSETDYDGDLDKTYAACMAYLKARLKEDELPIGTQVKESRAKKNSTGMSGVYATIQKNTESVRVSVTMFQPKGRTKNETIGYAPYGTVEYRSLIRDAKRIRLNNLKEEAIRQANLLPILIK